MISRLIAIVITVSCLSCSVVLQDGVRSSGLECSESRGYWIVDALFAISSAATAASMDAPAPVYAIPAVFVGSVLIGRYKRGNCVELHERTTPEQWASYHALKQKERERDESERRLREAEDERAQREYDEQRSADLAATKAALEQRKAELEAEQAARAAEPQAEPEPAPTPTPTSSAPRPPIEISVRRLDLEEVGKSCSLPGNADRDFPSAGSTCQHSMCYRGKCTIRCDMAAPKCPAGLTCRSTARPGLNGPVYDVCQ